MAPTSRSNPASASADARPQLAERNRMLRSLPGAVYAQILPHLDPFDAPARFILWQPDAPIRTVYFPRSCVVSHIVPLEGEVGVEAATVGREGFVGVPIVLGADSSATRTLVQVPGELAQLPVSVLREVQSHGSELTTMLLRYALALYEQTAQSVACIGQHSLEERCARWLLMTHDRVSGDEFMLTQDYLAAMLGVRRASVNVAASMLQRAGFITYRRGRITIIDRAGLEGSACGCYDAVRRAYERLLD